MQKLLEAIGKHKPITIKWKKNEDVKEEYTKDFIWENNRYQSNIGFINTKYLIDNITGKLNDIEVTVINND